MYNFLNNGINFSVIYVTLIFNYNITMLYLLTVIKDILLFMSYNDYIFIHSIKIF